MKKLMSAFLVMCLCACSSTNNTTQSTSGSYTAGTYTSTANGNNGEVEVSVTFTADAIEKVEVVSHSETAGLSDAPIADIPTAIVEKQSLAIETVSGATNTSNAILAAVEDCVKQAGGDVEVLKSASQDAVAKEAVTETTDLVVVGGGAAGLAAALRADELGQKVILVEKQSFLGGALSVSGGNQVVMGSKLQQEAGVSDDSVESMVDDFMKNGANLNVDELINLYASNVGTTTDWLNEYVGIQYNMEGGLHKLAEYSHDRELAYVDGGKGAATQFTTAVDNSNITVYLSTRANELIVDNGSVVGVKASSNDTDYTINAKAVILATGGYGNNKEMLTEEMQGALYYGPASSTGDGIVMATAEGIDAATRLMEYGKRYPNGIEVSEGIAKSTIAGNIAAFAQSAILVNPQGQRVVNEKSSNREILTVELEQTDSMLYLLLDQATFDLFRTKLEPAGISQSDIDQWLEANGTSTPVFAHGETLEELAKVVGMDATTLQSTVDTYNSYVEKGVDEEFGRGSDYLKVAIGEGPYYLIEQKPRFATTMGGLVVNESLQVENTKGEVINGLYAAGETVGGVMGDDSPSGANNGWALTSGKLAAEAVSQNLK